MSVCYSDDVTNLKDDVINDGQFAPGVKVDDLARPAEGGLLTPVVPQLLSSQHKPAPLPWPQSRVQLCEVATVVYCTLREGRGGGSEID